MTIITIKGPSICGEEVMTMKQSAAQSRMRVTHWELLRGFRMRFQVRL